MASGRSGHATRAFIPGFGPKVKGTPLKLGAVLAVLTAGLAGANPPAPNAITAVRHWSLGDVTRVVVETTGDFEFTRDRVPNPDRVFFDLAGTGVRLGKRGISTFPVNDLRLKRIRVAETAPGRARVVFDLEDGVEYSASMLSNPPRLIVELRRANTPGANVSEPVSGGPSPPAPVQTGSSALTAERRTSEALRPVIAAASLPPADEGSRVPLAVREKSPAGGIGTGSGDPQPPGPALGVAAKAVPETTTPQTRTPATPPKPAKLAGSQSMTRVLGLKIGRIVLDPGHGGHDTGTAGPRGLLEKDLALDICKRLGQLIETRLGAEVVYTRTGDTFVALERRTEIANESKADLFLSIHANSSPTPASSGVETYYLNFTTSKEAMQVAARENASSQKTVYDLTDLLHKIALQDKVDESRQFAARVQQAVYSASLKSNRQTRNRGVRRAPFIVLIGASMPSVLAEVGFISNPRDEALFRKPDFRQRIAEGLYQGIARYASTLSQAQVASN